MVEKITAETLTGLEYLIIRDKLGGRTLQQATEAADLEVAWILEYVARRRSDQSVTYEDVLKLSLEEVTQRLEEFEEEDPTDAGSGEPSPDSVTSGE